MSAAIYWWSFHPDFVNLSSIRYQLSLIQIGCHSLVSFGILYSISLHDTTIIPGRVMQTRKQSGVRRILKVCKESVRSEYAFAKLCQK